MDKTVTHVKTFTRIHLTPSTKELLCIVCGEKIENAQYRLKLLNKDVKTSSFEEKSAHTSDLWILFSDSKIKTKHCDDRYRCVDAMWFLPSECQSKEVQPRAGKRWQTVWTQIRPEKMVGPYQDLNCLTFWHYFWNYIKKIFWENQRTTQKKAWKVNYISIGHKHNS